MEVLGTPVAALAETALAPAALEAPGAAVEDPVKAAGAAAGVALASIPGKYLWRPRAPAARGSAEDLDRGCGS